jgi:hypothetical protein
MSDISSDVATPRRRFIKYRAAAAAVIPIDSLATAPFAVATGSALAASPSPTSAAVTASQMPDATQRADIVEYSRRCTEREDSCVWGIIAAAIVAGLGAGATACALADDARIRDTAPALKSMQPRMVDFVTCQEGSPPAGNDSATAYRYFRRHADVVANTTIVGLPGRAMTGGAAAEPANVHHTGTSPFSPRICADCRRTDFESRREFLRGRARPAAGACNQCRMRRNSVAGKCDENVIPPSAARQSRPLNMSMPIR